ncbi:hypothetical protein ACQCSX_22030 (plasmid) [Pseudarthrobacter sp. P1]|uniref:hypothetical protein n=1 Tax=Pseudarthrobacter sp. P1 TaxID=3418418 RepID=UPI003CEFCB20
METMTLTTDLAPSTPGLGAYTSPTVAPAYADGPDFDYAFEASRGAALARELQSMPKVAAREAVNASRISDLLRDSYGIYRVDGSASQSRRQAVTNLEAVLGHLPRDRRDHHVELIRFAVHEEMKHWSDPAHVLNPEHGYELLIDRDDYRSEDDLLEGGQDENRERWELLADTAAFHAAAEDNAF